MKNLTTDRRRIPWTPAAIVAFVMTAAAAHAQVGQFESWKETAKGRAAKTPCDHLRALTSYDYSIDLAVLVAAQGELLRYLRNRSALPSWERPNMLAKYFVTTTGTELSREGPPRPAPRIAPQ